MAILFLHGAGGFTDDRAIADALRTGLAEDVTMPHLSDGDMSHEGWARQIAANLGQEVDTVVGHSFGGSTLLKMLTETHLGIERLVLLAAPDWSAAGWDVPEYDLPADVEDRLVPALHIDLHHCLDDGVVPAHHQALLAARLPRATVIRHARGGHQFDGEALDAVVRRVLDTRNREPGDHPGVENVGSVVDDREAATAPSDIWAHHTG